MCKHMALVSDTNRFPQVNVYRYVVAIEKGLSTDETLYQKAELKYLLVKNIERVLKEASIDCPLLLNGNKFPEEIDQYKGCVEPTLENVKNGKKICPALCDFQECNLKCHDPLLNKYYDTKTNNYKTLDLKDVDYSSFNDNLAKNEIDTVKQKIKDLYRFKYVYMYDELKTIIISSFKKEQKLLFDDYFLDKALEDMMPRTENDYNNFKDTIYDKYNRPGYMIQRGKYYIYQPFDNSEEIPMYYRTNYELDVDNMTPIKNFIEMKYGDIKETITTTTDKTSKLKDYNLESVAEYYIHRQENYIVGILSRNASGGEDIFKIRPPLQKSADKKRGTGIYSLTGAVCATSKDKLYLLNIIKKLKQGLSHDIVKYFTNKMITREEMCNNIKIMLLYLEKYSTSKDNNKITYLMVPSDHPTLVFPYNLEDRIKYILQKVKDIVQREFDYVVKKDKKGVFDTITNLPSYTIEIKNNKLMEEHKVKLEKDFSRYNILIEKSLISIPVK